MISVKGVKGMISVRFEWLGCVGSVVIEIKLVNFREERVVECRDICFGAPWEFRVFLCVFIKEI